MADSRLQTSLHLVRDLSLLTSVCAPVIASEASLLYEWSLCIYLLSVYIYESVTDVDSTPFNPYVRSCGIAVVRQRRYDNPSPTRHSADGKLHNLQICGKKETRAAPSSRHPSTVLSAELPLASVGTGEKLSPFRELNHRYYIYG